MRTAGLSARISVLLFGASELKAQCWDRCRVHQNDPQDQSRSRIPKAGRLAGMSCHARHVKHVCDVVMLAGAGALEAQRSTDAWSIKAHSETMARQQELVAHYTAVSQPALSEVCSSPPITERTLVGSAGVNTRWRLLCQSTWRLMPPVCPYGLAVGRSLAESEPCKSHAAVRVSPHLIELFLLETPGHTIGVTLTQASINGSADHCDVQVTPVPKQKLDVSKSQDSAAKSIATAKREVTLLHRL